MEETIEDRLKKIKQLNRGRFDYVMQRSRTPQPSVEAACEAIGRKRYWYYDNLSPAERKELEDLADELHKAKVIRAVLILENAVDEAAQIKVEGMHSRDEKIKQASSTEVLNRVVGVPKQTTELTGKDGGAILIASVAPELVEKLKDV